MAAKKSFYEVLGVQVDASGEDIRAAHRRKLDALQAAQANLKREEFDYERIILKLALETLSDPAQRRDYDEKLAAQIQEQQLPVAAAPVLSRRADALSLRADALSLRADAMSIGADASLPATEGPMSSMTRAAKSSLRSVVMVIGAAAVVLAIAQYSNAYFLNRGQQSGAGRSRKVPREGDHRGLLPDLRRQAGERRRGPVPDEAA